MTRKMRTHQKKEEIKSGMWAKTVGFFKEILFVLACVLVINSFVLAAFEVPTTSMADTVLAGDFLFVNKFIYRFRDPERWEIIVFKYPEDTTKDFVKIAEQT